MLFRLPPPTGTLLVWIRRDDSPRDPIVHPIAPRITNAQSVTDGEISWAQRFSMKEFEIDHFRLQFEIENAMLYSFSFGN
jgi:hypothetical protein